MGGWVCVVFESILTDFLYKFRALFNIALTPVTYGNLIIERPSHMRYKIWALLLSAISSQCLLFTLINAYRFTLDINYHATSDTSVLTHIKFTLRETNKFFFSDILSSVELIAGVAQRFRLFSLALHRWGFYITHSDAPQSVRLLWTSGQLFAETSTWQHATLTTHRHPCPSWDSNPRSHQASGHRPTP